MYTIEGCSSSPGDSWSPFCVIRNIWAKIPRYTRIQFCSALILGLVVHMYILTNPLINHDSTILFSNTSSTHRGSGRWFAPIVDWITGTASLSWMNRFAALVYVSVSACFVGACLKVRNNISVVFLSAIMVSFPSLLVGLPYTRYVETILFAALLSCAAIFLAHRYRFGFLVGVIPLLLSLATYQAYIGLYAGVAVIILICDILVFQIRFRMVIIRGIKFAFCFIISNLLYLLSLKTPLVGDLSSYAHIDTLGGFTLQEIPARVYNAYLHFFRFFFQDTYDVHQKYLRIINFKYMFLLATIIIILLVAFVVRKHKIYRSKASVALLVILLGLLPLACNVITVISPDHLYLLMLYSLFLPYALGLSVIDITVMCTRDNPATARIKGLHLSAWVLLLILCLVVVEYSIVTNTNYLYIEVLNEQGLVYSSVFVARVQNEEYYSSEKAILLYGRPKSNTSMVAFANTNKISRIGLDYSLSRWYSYSLYLRYHIGLENPVYDETITGIPPPRDVEVLELLASMPEYPAKGSIVEFEGKIVVKLSDIS